MEAYTTCSLPSTLRTFLWNIIYWLVRGKVRDFWNTVLKVSSFLVLLSLTFLRCLSLVQDPDRLEPVMALLFLPRIAVCLKGISQPATQTSA
jgi:hypothetical protein